ncbi:MAG: IS200/IS605 family transposase [Dehalococcoidia bacterium]|nr:IS200/IS605 family transposase [Dehalococcoidia bacterium]
MYHVWFVTKRRKWLLEGEVGETAKELIAEVAQQRHIELLACESVVDHVHLLLRVGDRSELSRAMNLIKGKTSRLLFERFPDLRMDAKTSRLWQHRYGATIVPDVAGEAVKGYIATQWNRLEKYERP